MPKDVIAMQANGATRWLAALALVGYLGQGLAADIYRCPGPDGSVRFSDKPCDGSHSTVVTHVAPPLAGEARCERAGQIAYSTALKYKRGVGRVQILKELGAEADLHWVRDAVEIGYQYGQNPETLRKQAQANCRRNLARVDPAAISTPSAARDFSLADRRYRLTRLSPWQEIDADIRPDSAAFTFRSPKPEWAELRFRCRTASPDETVAQVGTWAENAVVAWVKPDSELERSEWTVQAGTVRVVKGERPLQQKVGDSGYRYANAYGLLGDGLRCDIVVAARFRGGDAIRNAEAMIRGLQVF